MSNIKNDGLDLYGTEAFEQHQFRTAGVEGVNAVLGVVILSARLSVTRVDCDKTKQCTAGILIPHEMAITLLLWHQQWLVGDAPFRLKIALKVTRLGKTADFSRFPFITSQP